MEEYRVKKRDLPTMIIDFEIAYDKVSREVLWSERNFDCIHLHGQGYVRWGKD